MGIRVVLVDDHEMLRTGLKAMLARQMDIEVVGEATDGREAIERVRELKPAIVVMDIGMPELNGIDATKRLLELPNPPKVVALSMHADCRYVSEMLAAGASCYVLKDSAFDELVHAIRAAEEGRTYLSGGVTGVVVEDYLRRVSKSSGPVQAEPVSGLSSREREVLQLIAEGHSTKEIAGSLHLSVKTIETHRRQLMTKLSIFSVAGLTKYAVRQGLVSLEG